ncbi:MAG: tetratricopeptide repeat protein [Bacteroidetes bacterium]|nr:MAG: tetratricopeptide repeat protein [Bacteroidota bacterium]
MRGIDLKILLFFFIFTSFYSDAFSGELDSLRQILQTSGSPEKRAEAYVELSEILYQQNPDTVVYLCQKALKELKPLSSHKTTDTQILEIKSDAYNNIGYIHKSKGRIDSAIYCYEQSLKLSRQLNDSSRIARILNNIAYLYFNQGNLDRALDYFFKSLAIKENLGLENAAAVTMNNIGLVYMSKNEEDKALEYYLKSLKIKEKLRDSAAVAILLNNIGHVYKNKNDFAKAKEYYTQSLEIYQKLKHEKGKALIYNNLAHVYSQQNDKQKALEYYQKAFEIEQKLGSKEDMSITLNNLSKVYLDLGDIKQAEKLAKKSYQLAKDLGYPKLIQNAAFELSNIYEQLNKPTPALQYYKEFVTMKDSLQSTKNERALVQKEMEYEFEKQKAIEEAKHQLELENQRKQKNIIITAILIVLTLVIIFVGFLFNRYQIIQKQKHIIETQKKIVEAKNEEIIDSITYAKHLQSAVFPPIEYFEKLFKEYFLIFRPKDIVSGDFYWMEQTEKYLFVAVADCTGHGVPGAMVSVVCANALYRIVNEFHIYDTGKILDKAREIIINAFSKNLHQEQIKDGMDISLIRICKENFQIQFSGANNPLWILKNGENTITEIKGNRQPVGYHIKMQPFNTQEIQLNPGDTVYLFSDGMQDQFGGPKHKKFKAKNIRRLITETHTLPLQKQGKIILSEFEKWKKATEQTDDVTLMGIRI